MKRGNRIVSAFSVGVIFSLGACSDKSAGREYALPDSVCGISVPKKKYDTLFPPGERISAESINRWGLAETGRTEGCRYYVDGKGSLGVSGEWRNSNDDLLTVRPSEVIRKFHGEKGKKYPGQFNVWTSKSGAAVAVECALEKEGPAEITPDRYLLRLSAGKKFDGDREEAHKVFGEFAQSLMAGILPKLPCKER